MARPTQSIEVILGRLRTAAEAFPRPGCDWEDPPRFEPPASIGTIHDFERTAGFKLPKDLVSFLSLTREVIGMSVHNGYRIGGLEALSRCIDRAGIPRQVENVPVIPVATDGGGNGFLMSEQGVVWAWDHEISHCHRVAMSFGEFLARVADDWEAYVEDRIWDFLV